MIVLAGGDTGKAGPLGLLVLVLLCIASYLLFKSMSRHLRRVREDWPGDTPAAGAADPDSATGRSDVGVTRDADTPPDDSTGAAPIQADADPSGDSRPARHPLAGRSPESER